MKISEKTVSALAQIITGDGGMSPYRSGPNLVKFFNDLGSNEVYGVGFPSRWAYCEAKIRELNDTPKWTQRREIEPFAAQKLSHSLKSGNLHGDPVDAGGKECFEWTRSSLSATRCSWSTTVSAPLPMKWA